MRDSIKKGLLVISGTLFLVLGVIGIFIPLLPTTPFLLLAAACYIKGPKKFYDWLIKNRWLGQYIKNYQDGKGIPFKVKIITIIVLWLTIMISTILFVSNLIIQIILIIIAIGVTIHIIKIKTLDKKEILTKIIISFFPLTNLRYLYKQVEYFLSDNDYEH